MENDIIIKLKQGKILGIRSKSTFSKHTYHSFCGIPYAKPPVNELRFRPPVPCGAWKGILDCRKDRTDCIHYAYIYKMVQGDEDCLYINVYIPEYPPPKKNLKSVIVHIHGGGYTFGSGHGEYYGSPEFVMHKDFVYVNFNYRLHVLGFLNLEIPECSGNVGIKDMVLALQWVNENIKAFGGDPDNITVLGCSSSACAIHLLMIHPQHRHLFKKAIMMGSCIANSSINYYEKPVERAQQLAEVMGCQQKNPKRLLHFFKSKTAVELVEGLNLLRKVLLPSNKVTAHHNLFIPSIEKFPEGAILTESPLNLLHTIDPIPVLYGICNLDGMQCFAQGSPVDQLRSDFKGAIRRILWPYEMDEDTLDKVAHKINKFYFSDNPISDKMCVEICNFFCDVWHAEIYKSFLDIIYHKNPETPIYVYEFAFEGSFNVPKKIVLRHLPYYIDGANHGDDYFYWVCINKRLGFKPDDAVVIEYMTEFLSNFAKFGDPNSNLSNGVHWKRYTPDHPSYLRINLKLKSVSGKLNEERMTFWEDLMEYLKSKCKLRFKISS